MVAYQFFKYMLPFLFLIFSQGWAQPSNKAKVLTGRITNAQFNVSGIHIINKNSSKNTITDNNGQFEILVHQNDSLVFNGISYKNKLLVINDSIYHQNYITVKLKERVTELKEVTIGSHNLSGNLEKDISKIPYQKQRTAKDIGLPVYEGIPQERIPTLLETFNYGLSINLEALQKHINGYYKRLKGKRKWDADTKLAEDVIYFYKKDFFLNTYNIPTDQVLTFIYFCMLTDKNFTSNFRNKNHELILKVFKHKSKLFYK